jgi:hypothetical protein
VKLLSTRARAELWKLQTAVRAAVEERNKVLRVLMHGRGVLTRDAQQELWMEFSSADQEYRFSVMQLAAFCERHGVRTAER